MTAMTPLEWWELGSYVVTVIGLPLAIYSYWKEQRRERENEEEELFIRLSDEYAEFLQLLLKNSDLELMSKDSNLQIFTPEQSERKKIIFDILVSLFERAYIIVYEENMSPQHQRLWASWDDYMRFWCKRKDFCAELPDLLQGEDPEFSNYILNISKQPNQRVEATQVP
jgi:hypothetical protein